MCSEKAADVALRLAPNSSMKGRRKMEKDWRGPMEIAHTVRMVPAMTQP
jgi:hypothetical protein